MGACVATWVFDCPDAPAGTSGHQVPPPGAVLLTPATSALPFGPTAQMLSAYGHPLPSTAPPPAIRWWRLAHRSAALPTDQPTRRSGTLQRPPSRRSSGRFSPEATGGHWSSCRHKPLYSVSLLSRQWPLAGAIRTRRPGAIPSRSCCRPRGLDWLPLAYWNKSRFVFDAPLASRASKNCLAWPYESGILWFRCS